MEAKGESHFSFLRFKIILTSIAVCVVAGILFFAYRRITFVRAEKKQMALANEITKVAELTVLKNRYSNVVCIKKSAVFGHSYIIVKFTGVLRAGIKDVSLIKVKFSPDFKSATVRLPACEILGNGLINQELFDEKRSVFVPIGTEELFSEIQSGMEKTAASCVDDGFLEEANVQVREIIMDFLSAYGITDVTIDSGGVDSHEIIK